jgi:single-strand selective monofunctional uracil DNA glycosylase
MAAKKRARIISDIKRATIELSSQLDEVVSSKDFPSDVFSYNPLAYARKAFFSYLDEYTNAPLDALFLGMNPGPNGMMQTGIPFGDISLVKNYLGISEGVTKPNLEHPKRPILGFDWPKSEVSGTRLWSFFQSQFIKPQSFFKKYFVLNYCPLGFLSETGSNVTPDKLNLATRKKVEAYCDDYLLQIVPLFEAKTLIGIGGYASKVFERLFPSSTVKTLLHPSPASPAANKGWANIASKQLQDAGINFNNEL